MTRRLVHHSPVGRTAPSKASRRRTDRPLSPSLAGRSPAGRSSGQAGSLSARRQAGRLACDWVARASLPAIRWERRAGCRGRTPRRPVSGRGAQLCAHPRSTTEIIEHTEESAPPAAGSGISVQPSAVSRQRSAVSRRPSATGISRGAVYGSHISSGSRHRRDCQPAICPGGASVSPAIRTGRSQTAPDAAGQRNVRFAPTPGRRGFNPAIQMSGG